MHCLIRTCSITLCDNNKSERSWSSSGGMAKDSNGESHISITFSYNVMVRVIANSDRF